MTHPTPPCAATPRYGERARPLRFVTVVALALAAFVWGTRAHAEADEPASRPPPASEGERARQDATPQPFSMGALAGIGFPRPVSLEVLTKLGGYVGLGVEYGVLPSITVDGFDASAWAVTFDGRVFPFRGAFFVGLRGGYQRLNASASVDSFSESASLSTWLVNPRLGFLWTFRPGFTLATEAGVQIPVTSSFSTTAPEVAAVAIRDNTVFRAAGGILPTVDLLRIGYMF